MELGSFGEGILPGDRLLLLLKEVTGIGRLRGKRNVEKKWKDFKEKWKQQRNK